MKQAATHLTTVLLVVLWTPVFLAASFVFAATPRPVLVHPVDQEVLPMGIPHFEWQPCFETRPDAMPSYVIQIAADEVFKEIVDADRHLHERPKDDIIDAWHCRVEAYWGLLLGAFGYTCGNSYVYFPNPTWKEAIHATAGPLPRAATGNL